MGVPTLGCGCAVCTSADPRDRRLRPSILLRWNEGDRERVVVIDTGPDFREQALRSGLTRVDAVFYTHGHADHIFGLDDLRPLSFAVFREGGHIPLVRVATQTEEMLRRIYDYTFSPDSHLSQPCPGSHRATRRLHQRTRRRFHSRAGAAWPNGDRRIPLWPHRISHGCERHSRFELCVARGTGHSHSFCVALQASSEPRHRGPGRDVGPTHRRPPDMAHAHCPRIGPCGG